MFFSTLRKPSAGPFLHRSFVLVAGKLSDGSHGNCTTKRVLTVSSMKSWLNMQTYSAEASGGFTEKVQV